MRSFVLISAMLAAVLLLTVQYSFWMASAILYMSGMFVVAVIAFAGRCRPSGKSTSSVLNDKTEQTIIEGNAASEDLKAA